MAVDASASPNTTDPGRVAPSRRHGGRGPAAWVAMYHSVSACPDDPYDITVTPERFGRQLDWLRRRGLRGVSVAELLDARARGEERGLIGLTFDDGYSDFVTAALPVLRRYDCNATVFLLSGRLGGENDWEHTGPVKRLLDAASIRQLADEGVEIASHGLTHADLASLPDPELGEEVQRSRDVLAQITGVPVQGFCYPYGKVDERVKAAVERAGYRYACAIAPDPGFVGDLALPRIHIGQHDSALRLELKRRLARVWGRAVSPA
ncbi:polysaccharide deacetylase family protein [Streptomyces polyrhachis]|uniref:Polysaccharide deacetylase family protein n=1 Tax=Streptomyces polyrhachis TaxID=1282885 RepID=A0ABW2GJK5_9ACTN